MLQLPAHQRYAYSPIVKRPDYAWPGGKRLAFYIALNIEHFAFGTGIGMDPSNRSGSRTREISPGATTAIGSATGACSRSWTS
jgi:hypothetical protein